jgi:large subunit ribosomal protein L11
VNIGEFVKRFNDATKDQKGTMIPVIISIYVDRSFDFITKSPPASELLKQAAGLAKGSATPHTDKVGKVSKAQVRQIAERKLKDLNARDVDAAMKIVMGTARSMGVEVKD